MEKVTIEVPSKDELLDCLNNGFIALKPILLSFCFCITDNLPLEWYEWFQAHNCDYDKCAEIIYSRRMLLLDIMQQIEKQKKEESQNENMGEC